MTEYELTRRDALAVLASLGIGTAAATGLTWDGLVRESGDAGELDDHDRNLLCALADIVYPSAVSGVDEFVETYVVGRLQDDPNRIAGVADSLDYLDNYAVEWYDAPFLDLSPDRRETVLEGMGADVADPDLDGSDVERLRFYLINDLLYALYTSPTGGELVGIENPQGHPGGTGSYQRPPE